MEWTEHSRHKHIVTILVKCLNERITRVTFYLLSHQHTMDAGVAQMGSNPKSDEMVHLLWGWNTKAVTVETPAKTVCTEEVKQPSSRNLTDQYPGWPHPSHTKGRKRQRGKGDAGYNSGKFSAREVALTDCNAYWWRQGNKGTNWPPRGRSSS